ncbi:MAG: AraC family transcriptional regulator [Bacteroidales bacterium]
MRKRDGFNNQLAIVLPKHIHAELAENPLTKLLFITDVGYYPVAKYHYRERPDGCEQNVLIFCTEGNGWIEVNGTTRRIAKDTFLIIPAGLPHKYGADNLNPWTIYWFHFAGLQAAGFCSGSLTVSGISSVENTRNDRRKRLFEEIYQTLSMGYSKENLEYTSVCLWYLLGSFNYLPQFERIRTIQKTDVIEKSILYMHEHIKENITLHDMATHCGYSASHFSAIFRKKTTRSPIDYYLDLKMQNACQQLDFTDKKIKEIAADLTFADPFYFSRLFKRFIGISPGDYRVKKKG